MIPSAPVGYADDIATACISKLRTDYTLDIVYEFGCKWRFKFNAKKSAVLVHGESKQEHIEASRFRTFKLGKNKVDEKLEYDHVLVKACILAGDNSKVEEKIGKGRKTLNATSGLGIRKNVLSMKTCNLIFWTIVVPALPFGSEIWCINDREIDLLQSFQRYAGRRIQRFPKRSPRCTSYYGLGWIRIETYIQIKKLLFVLTMISMNNDNRIRMIFDERVNMYINNVNNNELNNNQSPIFDMLNVSLRFGLLRSILDMVFGFIPVMSKKIWSNRVWQAAWKLDDLYWKSTSIVYDRNDLLFDTIGSPLYLNWWFLADNMHYLQGMCETMARLVCHTSLLKDDDVRLNKGSHLQVACANCDLGIRETIKHLVMQCPSNENRKLDMLREIKREVGGFAEICSQAPEQVFLWLMGKSAEGIEPKDMVRIWIIAGLHISRMYRDCIIQREGIG